MTPDLIYYWEGAREWCEDNKWDEEKKNVAKACYYHHTQHPYPFPVFYFLYLFVHSSNDRFLIFWCSSSTS